MNIKRTASALLLFGSLTSASSAFAAGMSCYVDTPAWDVYTPGSCFAVIWGASTATAFFRIDNPPANRYIIWNQPNCATNALYCSATIHAYQPYVAEATVIDLDAGTIEQVSAQAWFEAGH